MEAKSVRSHQLEVIWFDFAEQLASRLCYWEYHTCYCSCNWKCSTLTPLAVCTFRKQKPEDSCDILPSIVYELQDRDRVGKQFSETALNYLSSGSSFFLMKHPLVIYTSLLLKCMSCRLYSPVLFCSNSSSCGHLFGQVRGHIDVHMYKRGWVTFKWMTLLVFPNF